MNERRGVLGVREGGTGVPVVPPNTVLVGTGQDVLLTIPFEEFLSLIEAASVDHTHSAVDIVDGKLPPRRGGIGNLSFDGVDSRFFLSVNDEGTGFVFRIPRSGEETPGTPGTPGSFTLRIFDINNVEQTGEALRLAGAFTVFTQGGDLFLTLSPTVNLNSVSSTVVLDYTSGATQRMSLDANTTISSVSNLVNGGTMNVRILLNNHTLTLSGTSFEGPRLTFTETDVVVLSFINFGLSRIFVSSNAFAL